MFSNEARCILDRNPLLEVICQLRFPEILRIETNIPADFQDAIRADYPQYSKNVEQMPPQIADGKQVAQGTVNNYQFVSEDSQWKVSLTKGFIALSTHRYTRWEDFARRLDQVLAAFIRIYAPAYFSRVGLRYINAINKKAFGLEEYAWRDLITSGYLGLMGDEDAQEQAFVKNEQSINASMPGGAKAGIKCGPGTMRRVNNRTGQSTQEQVFMLDLDLFMDGKTPINHAVPALNIVHGNADSLFRGAVTDTLLEAMGPHSL